MQRALTNISIIVFGYLMIGTPSFALEPTSINNHWRSCFEYGKGIWRCIGKVEIDIKKTYDYDHDTIGNYIITSFTNGEFLFEDVSSTTSKKILNSPKYSHGFLYGINGEKEANALFKKYRRANELLLGILLAVATGFPEGADALPDTWVSRNVDVEGPLQVSVQKIKNDAFKFRIQNKKLYIEGEWAMLKASPWPDNQSMDGWTIEGKKTIRIQTLGEVRRLARLSPYHK